MGLWESTPAVARTADPPDRHAVAWQRSAGERPELASKRSLVAVSHAIERALLAGPVEAPTVVFAMFQRMTYFERERETYRRLLDAGVHVVVGFTEARVRDLPVSAVGVTVMKDEPLAEEWTVVALGPRAGAFLVATDQHSPDPTERRGLEAARRFAGRWGFARTRAAVEMARLRLTLGARLPPTTAGIVDRLVAGALPTGEQAASGAGTPGETWATTSLFHLVDQVQIAWAGNRDLRARLADAHAAAITRSAATTDPQSGLATPDLLARWAGAEDRLALPLGIGLFDVAELEDAGRRYDPRRAHHAARTVAAALTQPLGPGDAAVRISERRFAVVVPGASPRHLAAVCDDIVEQLVRATAGYPHVPLHATVAATVTRSRPLPLDDLGATLDCVPDGIRGVHDAGTTRAGDPVIVLGVSPRVSPRGARTDHDDVPRAEVAGTAIAADTGVEHRP